MKVTINKPEDSIDLSMVTEDMTTVAVENGKAVGILSKIDVFYTFMAVNNINKGMAWTLLGNKNIPDAITSWIGISDKREVHAFHTYQEAFRFIAENL